MRCRMNLVADPANISSPQFVNLGLSTINALDKSAIIWTPYTIVGRTIDVAHGSAPDHIFEEVIAVEKKVSAKSDCSYKLIFKFGGKIRTLSTKIMQGFNHLWNQLLLVRKIQTPKH